MTDVNPEFDLKCEYRRERKKRGKASRKDIAAQKAIREDGQQTQSSPKSDEEDSSEDQSPQASPSTGSKRRRIDSQGLQQHGSIARNIDNDSRESQSTPYTVQQQSHRSQPLRVNQHPEIMQSGDRSQGAAGAMPTAPIMPTSSRISVTSMNEHQMPMNMGEFNTMDDYHRSVLHNSAAVNGQHLLHNGRSVANTIMPNATLPAFQDNAYGVPSPQSHNQNGPLSAFRLGDSPGSGGFMGVSPNAGSPGWLAMPSPSGSLYQQWQQSNLTQAIRYPVLKPILPRISAIIPVPLACDLLELFFSSTATAFMQPASPYILGFVLRKNSILRQNEPRQCSPALLASMLWVGAQTSESSFLTSPPSQRGKICQQLLELTVSLLNPLIHTTTDGSTGYGNHLVTNGVALGGFGMAHPASHNLEPGSTGATCALDDVATYINLATVVSASEYKAASLRWWNAAWSLARELKLGRELPLNPEPPRHQEGPDTNASQSNNNRHSHGQNVPHPNMPQPNFVTEEEREERRRIWWLLYTVDRHLALCYNRPLFLLDVECDGLLQPESDAIWQAGDYYPPENHTEFYFFRRRGPSFECTGHSMFGYFLPLMTILGEIVDLNHARNHPRFGTRFLSGGEEQAQEISQQLEAYGRSLKAFEARWAPAIPADGPANGTEAGPLAVTSPSIRSTSTPGPQAVLQTKIVVAYGTHLMHTLHILLNGKWDPISLLDDNDLWISSQSFISATGHAVSASEAIEDILEYDPDLSFMPFFYGIYLLQGSFLLLLIADKLQGEASPSVVKACETIVRAHEVCVVTLNTEYQVCLMLFPSFSCRPGYRC